MEGERMLQRWLVGGNARLRSWQADRSGLTVGCASLIPVQTLNVLKSKHSSLYSTSSIHKHFPTEEGRRHNERPFCQRFCACYADRKWKGLRSRKNLLLHPLFKRFIPLFNQSESQYVCARMCAWVHFWHSFNVYWHRCMRQLWPPLWWCQIRKLGEMRGDLMKGERRDQERWMFYLHHMESLKYPRLCLLP